MTSTLSTCQKSDKWNTCKCKWAPWSTWSRCSRLCWGIQIRKRRVWKLNTPECTGFKVCDAGKGAVHLQRCNDKCTAGSYNKTERKCVCPAGLYGTCCDQELTCGKAPAILNSNIPDMKYNYSDVINYECRPGYTLEGASQMRCGEVGWDGELPKCIANNPCDSISCPLNEMCQPNGTSYACYCPKNAPCDLELAPEVVRCPSNKNISTSGRTVKYEWPKPKFKDINGEQLDIQSNYPSNHFRFPWGMRTVLYTAMKNSNGKSASCQFSVHVKPFPCPDMSAPSKGFIVCSNWRTDYGRFCLVGCTGSYKFPPDFDARQWVVCGSTGSWTPANIPKECHVMFSGKDDESTSGTLPKVQECLHPKIQEELKDHFTKIFLQSPFKSFCDGHRDLCVSENVKVTCWNAALVF